MTEERKESQIFDDLKTCGVKIEFAFFLTSNDACYVSVAVEIYEITVNIAKMETYAVEEKKLNQHIRYGDADLMKSKQYER